MKFVGNSKISPFMINESKRLLLCILAISLNSCREKSFGEFEESEFYKSQGIIVSAKRTKSILDDPFVKEIKYEYFVNDSTILEDSEDFSFVDRTKGVPVEVLVHKKDPEISFYWRNGISDNATAFQLEYSRKKMDSVLSKIKGLE